MPNATLQYARFERSGTAEPGSPPSGAAPPPAGSPPPGAAHPDPAPRTSARPLAAALVAAALLAAGPAVPAEAPREAVAAAGIAIPQPPVERHRDWRLDCRADCRIETVVLGADGHEVLRLGVPGPGAPMLRVETALPLYLPDAVEVGAGGEAWRLPWLTCGPRGCEALAALDGPLLAALRHEREAQVALTLLDGTRVRLAVSLMGFAAAEAALGARAE